MATCVHCTSENHPDLLFCETCGKKIRGEELETKADSKADSKRGGAKLQQCHQCTFEYQTADSSCPVCNCISAIATNVCGACSLVNKQGAKKCETCGCELGPSLAEQYALQSMKATQAATIASSLRQEANKIGKLLGRYHDGDADLAASIEAAFRVEQEERRNRDAIGLAGAPHIYRCPHCAIPLSIDQVNCGIFICGCEISTVRNASTQLPQHDERNAMEKVQQQRVKGCGRQFTLDQNTNTLVPCTGR